MNMKVIAFTLALIVPLVTTQTIIEASGEDFYIDNLQDNDNIQNIEQTSTKETETVVNSPPRIAMDPTYKFVTAFLDPILNYALDRSQESSNIPLSQGIKARDNINKQVMRFIERQNDDDSVKWVYMEPLTGSKNKRNEKKVDRNILSDIILGDSYLQNENVGQDKVENVYDPIHDVSKYAIYKRDIPNFDLYHEHSKNDELGNQHHLQLFQDNNLIVGESLMGNNLTENEVKAKSTLLPNSEGSKELNEFEIQQIINSTNINVPSKNLNQVNNNGTSPISSIDEQLLNQNATIENPISTSTESIFSTTGSKVENKTVKNQTNDQHFIHFLRNHTIKPEQKIIQNKTMQPSNVNNLSNEAEPHEFQLFNDVESRPIIPPVFRPISNLNNQYISPASERDASRQNNSAVSGFNKQVFSVSRHNASAFDSVFRPIPESNNQQIFHVSSQNNSAFNSLFRPITDLNNQQVFPVSTQNSSTTYPIFRPISDLNNQQLFHVSRQNNSAFDSVFRPLSDLHNQQVFPVSGQNSSANNPVVRPISELNNQQIFHAANEDNSGVDPVIKPISNLNNQEVFPVSRRNSSAFDPLFRPISDLNNQQTYTVPEQNNNAFDHWINTVRDNLPHLRNNYSQVYKVPALRPVSNHLSPNGAKPFQRPINDYRPQSVWKGFPMPSTFNQQWNPLNIPENYDFNRQLPLINPNNEQTNLFSRPNQLNLWQRPNNIRNQEISASLDKPVMERKAEQNVINRGYSVQKVPKVVRYKSVPAVQTPHNYSVNNRPISNEYVPVVVGTFNNAPTNLYSNQNRAETLNYAQSNSQMQEPLQRNYQRTPDSRHFLFNAHKLHASQWGNPWQHEEWFAPHSHTIKVEKEFQLVPVNKEVWIEPTPQHIPVNHIPVVPEVVHHASVLPQHIPHQSPVEVQHPSSFITINNQANSFNNAGPTHAHENTQNFQISQNTGGAASSQSIVNTKEQQNQAFFNEHGFAARTPAEMEDTKVFFRNSPLKSEFLGEPTNDHTNGSTLEYLLKFPKNRIRYRRSSGSNDLIKNLENEIFKEAMYDRSNKHVRKYLSNFNYLNRLKRSLPLVRLATDPNAKLDMAKTIENIGTITRNSFDNKRAPLHHIKNFVGSSRDAVMSALKVIPQDMIVPSRYKIVDTNKEIVLKPEQLQAMLKPPVDSTSSEEEPFMDSESPPKLAVKYDKPEKLTFLERLAKLRAANSQRLKSSIKTKLGDLKNWQPNFLKSRLAEVNPSIGQSPNDVAFDQTFQRIGNIVRDSIKSGQETAEHINDALHSGRKIVNTLKMAAPRILLPYGKAPVLEKRPWFGDGGRLTFIAPRIFDVADDNVMMPKPADYKPEFVKVGDIMDAIGLSNPNEQRVGLKRIIIQNNKPGSILQSRFGSNKKAPEIDSLSKKLYVISEDIDDKSIDTGKLKNIMETMKGITDVLGDASLKDFIGEMKTDYYLWRNKMRKAFAKSSETEEVPNLESRLSEAPQFSEEEEWNKFLQQLFAEEKDKLARSNDDNVGVSLNLPDNLKKPFMNQASQYELQEFFRSNGDNIEEAKARNDNAISKFLRDPLDIRIWEDIFNQTTLPLVTGESVVGAHSKFDEEADSLTAADKKRSHIKFPDKILQPFMGKVDVSSEEDYGQPYGDFYHLPYQNFDFDAIEEENYYE